MVYIANVLVCIYVTELATWLKLILVAVVVWSISAVIVLVSDFVTDMRDFYKRRIYSADI